VDVACRRADGDVWVANYNAPGQVVIAGEAECVARAGAIAKENGAKKVMPLQVGGAFHTPYMGSARNRLRKALREATFHAPEVPVIANVDALPHEDADEWASLLSAQLLSPVRWRQTLLRLEQEGRELVVELGNGGVLTGLARRTIPEVNAVAVSAPADLDRLVSVMAGDPPLSTHVGQHHGERFYMSERLVVSPAAGVFNPTDADANLEVGALLGNVGETEVRSPFAGELMKMLAMPGERVQVGQPIAWLRAS
jgi:[acyl-carrier-protein] S-malonyltransferase